MVKVTLMVEAETDAYGPEEAAKLLGKGEATIWRRIRDGEIMAVKVGNRTLIPAKEVERLQKELVDLRKTRKGRSSRSEST
jgi:excisionase family DNA binding protein